MLNDQLIPEKHAQLDLFLCDVADAVLKDIIPQLEHPFYSLSKKPERKIRRYEHNGNWLEVIPSVLGLATIYDKDILIYAISQIMAKLNRNERVSRKIAINCRELLIFTNRGTAGKDYEALCHAINRLAGTRISTNITYGDTEKFTNFGLIDQGSIERTNGPDGRLKSISITISDWVFDAIRNKAVLTLHRDYFRLRKPIERRTYEIARKHCGKQKEWSINLDLLHKKTGSQSPVKKFRMSIKNISDHNHLPDYTLIYDKENDKVIFKNREKWWDKKSEMTLQKPFVHDTETYEKAKEYLRHGEDIYQLEQEWVQHWIDTGCREIKHDDLAFIGFVKARYFNF